VNIKSEPQHVYAIFRRDYTPPGKEEPLYFRGTYQILTQQGFNILAVMGYCERAVEPTMAGGQQ
jgi:hypothetical protein